MLIKKILLFLFFFTLSVFAQVNVNIPAVNSGIVDDIIDVPIIVDDLTGLGVLAYQTTITYDASVVEAIGIETTGTLSSSSGWTVLPNTGTAGEIRIGGFGASDLSGGGVLVYMKFHLIGEAGTSTDLHFTEMLFNSGTPACSTTDGAIVINTGGGSSVEVNIPAEIAG